MKVAKDAGVIEPQVGDTTLTINGVNNNDGAKILATKTGGATATDAGKAALIVSSVRGEEMLAEIVKSKEIDEEVASPSGSTTAVAFAKGGTNSNLVGGSAGDAKAAAVVGGIAPTCIG